MNPTDTMLTPTLLTHLIIATRHIAAGDIDEIRIADLQAAMHVYVEHQAHAGKLDMHVLIPRYTESYNKYRAEFATVVKSKS